METRSKFKTLCESVTTRLQNGGILVGDYVTFKKEAFSSDWMRSQAQSVLQKIGEYTNGEEPTLLKVFMIKTGAAQAYGAFGASEDTTMYPMMADIGIEASPGFAKDVMTVPVQLLELVEVEANTLPKQYVDALKKEGSKHLKRTNKDSLEDGQKVFP